LTPTAQHTLWASVARAVRTPSRAELGARIDTYLYPPGAFVPGPLPVLASIRPHQEFDLPAETLDEIDVGWRTSIAGKAWLDVAAFAGRYRDLLMSRLGLPTFVASPAHLVIPVVTDLRGRGRTAGIELAAEWEFAPGLRANGRYSFLDLDIERPGNPAGDALAATYADYTPRHHWGVGIVWDPAPRWKVDLRLRGIAGLSAGLSTGSLAGYTAVDVRVAHKPLRNLEIELVGRNLGAGSHVEMESTYMPALPLEIVPSFGVGLRWSF
jgi:iron complex outermembrane receptor protein